MPASLLARAACIADLKRRAKRRVPRFAFDYLEGGCSSEAAVARNRRMLDAVVMEPRYLEDCAAPDLSVSSLERSDIIAETWPPSPGPVWRGTSDESYRE